MRDPIRRVRNTAALAALAVALPLMTACPKHENFPQPLDVHVVPKPQSFVITQPDPDVYDYDFTWSIDDPDGIVVGYRIYAVGSAGGLDELIGETTQTSFLATFPFSVSGVQFAVSAVSSENVEGYKNVKVAP